MFDIEELKLIEEAGYQVVEGRFILDAEGNYVPSIDYAGKTIWSASGPNEQEYLDRKERLDKAVSQGFELPTYESSDDIYKLEQFEANQIVKKYLKAPIEKKLEVSNPFVISELDDVVLASENEITKLLNTNFINNEDLVVSKIPILKKYKKTKIDFGKKISGIYGLKGTTIADKKDYYLKLEVIKKQLIKEHGTLLQEQKSTELFNRVKDYGEVVIVLILIIFFIKKIIK